MLGDNSGLGWGLGWAGLGSGLGWVLLSRLIHHSQLPNKPYLSRPRGGGGVGLGGNIGGSHPADPPPPRPLIVVSCGVVVGRSACCGSHPPPLWHGVGSGFLVVATPCVFGSALGVWYTHPYDDDNDDGDDDHHSSSLTQTS